MPSTKATLTADARGRQFVSTTSWFLILVVVTYLWAHAQWSPESTVKKPESLVHLDGWGRASIISADDIEWNVGEEKALPLMAVMQERTKRIETQLTKLQELTGALSDRVAGARARGLAEIHLLIARGDKTNTFEKIEKIRTELAPSTLGVQGVAAVERIQALLADLERLHLEQTLDHSRLRTPDRYVVFWMTPALTLVEVACWALFGVFTSVLYHASQYLSQNKFSPSEEIVATSKLLYAPMISVVMVLSLWGGIITFSGPTSRVWVTPVLAFLFGFNARKAADAVDAISHKILDRFRSSPLATAASTGRFATYYRTMRGATFNDVREEAKQVARNEVLVELLKMERKS